MIIKLLTYKLFTENPDLRFSRQTGLKEGVLNDLYYKYDWLGWKREELIEWFEWKYKMKLSTKCFNGWMVRVKIFRTSQFHIKKGVRVINIVEFTPLKPYEKFILHEITHRESKSYLQIFNKQNETKQSQDNTCRSSQIRQENEQKSAQSLSGVQMDVEQHPENVKI